MNLTHAGFLDWREKGRKLLIMASNKGNSSRSTRRPRLDRSFGHKGIDYDSRGSQRRRWTRSARSEIEDDDSDRSSQHSEEWETFEEFSVHGKQDVAEMNSIFRYLGLPGPANLGIDNEAYELIKRTPTGSPVLEQYTPRHASDPDFVFPLQISDRGSSHPAFSPQEKTPPSCSPLESSQPLGQFCRTEPEIVDAALPVPLIATPKAYGVSAQVENRTSTAAGAAVLNRESDGGAGRTNRPSSPALASVVRKAMAHQAKIQDEAAEVETFIMCHGDGQLSRHASFSDPVQDTRSHRSLPSSVRSGSGTASKAGSQPVGRSQSDPAGFGSSSWGDETLGLNGRIGGSSLSWKPVVKTDDGELFQNKSTNQDSGVPSTSSKAEPRPKVNDKSSNADSVSHRQLPVLGTSKTADFLDRPEARDVNTKSVTMILKPPPPMSIIRISQEQISTNDILGLLAPDAAEGVARSYFSASDEEEENSPQIDNEHESAHVSEASSPVSGANFERSDILSNGDVTAVAADEKHGQGKSNGDVSTVAGNDWNGRAQRTDLTVDVPERTLIQVEQARVVENPAPDLPPIVQTPVVVMGPKHPWSKGEMLGQGSFGTVYDAVDSKGMWFAVKEVSMVEQDKQAQQCIAQLMQEVELLSKFKHDNVVQYLGTEKAHGKLYIFLELVSRGSLASIYKKIQLTHSQISAYTRQILKGLKYLHDRHVVHRDIKCANILVDTDGTCKLADFGMAKQMNSLDQMKSCKGSAYWMAPEVIDPKKFSGLPADIWSLGCSILEMATGSPPFGDLEWYRVLWLVGHGTPPSIPDTLSEVAKDFIKRCLDVNPTKRPSATELLNHPFVQQDVALTSTSQNEEISFQASSNALRPISEENSADLSSAPSTQDASSKD